MHIESLFTDQKWNILQALSSEPQSPLQLSLKLNTTIANISQQLKLLEAVNLVKKEKVRNRDKGKPRTLFSLVEEYALLIPTTKHFAQKKLFKITSHQKTILKIWFLPQELQQSAESLYWELRQHHPYVSLATDSKSDKLYIIAENKKELTSLSKQATILSTKEAATLELNILHQSSPKVAS